MVRSLAPSRSKCSNKEPNKSSTKHIQRISWEFEFETLQNSLFRKVHTWIELRFFLFLFVFINIQVNIFIFKSYRSSLTIIFDEIIIRNTRIIRSYLELIIIRTVPDMDGWLNPDHGRQSMDSSRILIVHFHHLEYDQGI